MTTANRELFELCKQVYEATGWTADMDKGVDYVWCHETPTRLPIDWDTSDFHQHIPIYTSDYLLEKLPPALWVEVSGEGQQVALLALNMQGNGEAIAVYEIPYDKEFRGSYSSHAVTPLEALLKLTLNLHEEGLI